MVYFLLQENSTRDFRLQIGFVYSREMNDFVENNPKLIFTAKFYALGLLLEALLKI